MAVEVVGLTLSPVVVGIVATVRPQRGPVTSSNTGAKWGDDSAVDKRCVICVCVCLFLFQNTPFLPPDGCSFFHDGMPSYSGSDSESTKAALRRSAEIQGAHPTNASFPCWEIPVPHR